MTQWFSNLRIRRKLQFTVGLMLTGLVATALFSLRQLSVVNEQVTVITRDWLPGVERVAALESAILEYRVQQYAHLSALDHASMTAVEQQMAAQRQRIDEAAKAYEATIILDSDRALFARYTAQAQEYLETWPAVAALSRADRTTDARIALARTQEPFERLAKTLHELITLNHDESEKATAVAAAAYASARHQIAIVLMVFVVVGIVLVQFASTHIERAVLVILDRASSLQRVCLTGLQAGLDAMARGDTSVTVVPKTTHIRSSATDEIGRIANTVDGMITLAQAAVASYSVMQGVIARLVAQVHTLTASAREGRIGERADAAAFDGSYRELVHGLNAVLDAVATPLGEAQQVLVRVADRDLTAQVTGAYAGEYRTLADAINTAVRNVAETLEEVASAAGQVAAAGEQIAATSQSLAGGASEQAASTQEITASMTELASTASRTQANSSDALHEADEATSSARLGHERMQRLTEAVAEIQSGSIATAKVVKTIEEIAFQTNLLALNAAVEAARAGDAGRGFAVVADEVRTLAIRSAAAARDTAALIEESVRTVGRGVAINDEARATFDAILMQVGRVRTAVEQIATASVEQTTQVLQVNSALEQLNTSTQQVAANAEESASTAEELASQAQVLNGIVSGFALPESERPPRGQATRRKSRPAVVPTTATRHARSARAFNPFDGDDAIADDSELLAVF